MGEIQYLTDEQGKRTAALVPIEEWERIQAEMRSLEETLYLLRSEKIRSRASRDWSRSKVKMS
jgi:PHD/YefM family antitoxin component YafN of YafNO toxin-antitoxin module